jgi:hypothetical protein
MHYMPRANIFMPTSSEINLQYMVRCKGIILANDVRGRFFFFFKKKKSKINVTFKIIIECVINY